MALRELREDVSDNFLFAKCTSFTKDKKSRLTDEHVDGLNEILGDEDQTRRVTNAAKSSMGMDTDRMISLALTAREDAHRRSHLSALLGETVVARLVQKAGSLTSLAKCPASTVQVLDAEKALFRVLKTKGNTPKHGLIYHSSFIGRACAKNKGRISRCLANKCSITSRIDSCIGEPTKAYREQLRDQVEERLKFYDTGDAPRKNVDAMTAVFQRRESCCSWHFVDVVSAIRSAVIVSVRFIPWTPCGDCYILSTLRALTITFTGQGMPLMVDGVPSLTPRRRQDVVLLLLVAPPRGHRAEHDTVCQLRVFILISEETRPDASARARYTSWAACAAARHVRAGVQYFISVPRSLFISGKACCVWFLRLALTSAEQGVRLPGTCEQAAVPVFVLCALSLLHLRKVCGRHLRESRRAVFVSCALSLHHLGKVCGRHPRVWLSATCEQACSFIRVPRSLFILGKVCVVVKSSTCEQASFPRARRTVTEAVRRTRVRRAEHDVICQLRALTLTSAGARCAVYCACPSHSFEAVLQRRLPSARLRSHFS
eukprot:gene34330-42342_t